MSKDLQKMMASKYPTSSQLVMKDSAPVVPLSTSTKDTVLTPKKMLAIAILLAGLFFVLALPYTFKSVGSFFPLLNSNSTVDPKLVALHAIVFAVIVFFILRLC
ncbi:MAG: hypothetical protein PHG66_06075 [Candidatus Colwellbacteria bacterium]|nr:hypothetical protein [Candidatus Colwellbacteria bacterium]